MSWVFLVTGEFQVSISRCVLCGGQEGDVALNESKGNLKTKEKGVCNDEKLQSDTRYNISGKLFLSLLRPYANVDNIFQNNMNFLLLAYKNPLHFSYQTSNFQHFCGLQSLASTRKSDQAIIFLVLGVIQCVRRTPSTLTAGQKTRKKQF